MGMKIMVVVVSGRCAGLYAWGCGPGFGGPFSGERTLLRGTTLKVRSGLGPKRLQYLKSVLGGA